MKNFKLLAVIVLVLTCANGSVANEPAEPEHKPFLSDKETGVIGGICRFINAFRQADKNELKRFRFTADGYYETVSISQGSQEDTRDVAQHFWGRITKENLTGSVEYPKECPKGRDRPIHFLPSHEKVVEKFDKTHLHIQIGENSVDTNGNIVLGTTINTNDCHVLKNSFSPSASVEVYCKNKRLYRLTGINRVECDGTDVTKKLEKDYWKTLELVRKLTS